MNCCILNVEYVAPVQYHVQDFLYTRFDFSPRTPNTSIQITQSSLSWEETWYMHAHHLALNFSFHFPELVSFWCIKWKIFDLHVTNEATIYLSNCSLCCNDFTELFIYTADGLSSSYSNNPISYFKSFHISCPFWLPMYCFFAVLQERSRKHMSRKLKFSFS